MRVGFIFPGQGSQSVGMGQEIYGEFKAAKELLDSASEYCDIDFKSLLFEENDKLGQSEFTQPAIVLNSLMCFEALKHSLDLQAQISFGHSLGEFSALSVSGAIKPLEVIKLVNLRGKFMTQDCLGIGAGMMVVLGLSNEKVEEICKNSNRQIWLANYNCDGQIVVAGIRSDLELSAGEFKSAGAKRAMLLDMSVASHCPLLQNASIKLANELEGLLSDEFSPVVSNVTAKIYSTKKEALELLKLQLVSPVLYQNSVENYANSVDCFIEFGASVLKGMNKKICDKPTYSITNLSSLKETLEALR
ncbi:ACP S-malonyltransferase [Campylobacter porcelli]|uniref:Malonyl CoA-acyl carrier protein transacylase n=1 Tax=Campylobacter porcelli TaxID=1660073 RepID=A0ABU7M6F8_9BACT|nr:ACP S-malonyltransferase [Campylobacter sp. CX2-4855-23]